MTESTVPRMACTIAHTAYSLNNVGAIYRPDILALITEGRHSNAKYSWCGDFVTYVLSLVLPEGIASECLNRVATRGSWKPGWNLIMLMEYAKQHDKLVLFHEGDSLQIGDVIRIKRENGDHICILAALPSDDQPAYITMDGNGWNAQYGNCVHTTKRTVVDLAQQIRDVARPCDF